MRTPDTPRAHFVASVVSRRNTLAMLSSTAVLAACSGGSSSPTPTPTPTPTTPSGFSATQLTAGRTYQRATMTGGANGTGQGTITQPITLTATASLIEYRLRDATTMAVRQDWTAAATSVAANTTSITLPNVPAAMAWNLVDLRADSDNSQIVLGTSRVAMGALTVVVGRSQPCRWMARVATGDTDTNATLGVTISPYGSIFATFQFDTGTLAVNTPYWTLPSDSGDYTGTGVSSFLAGQVADTGVNCAVIGRTQGQVGLATFLIGATGTDDDILIANLDAAGGFENYWLWQNDLDQGDTATLFKSRISTLFSNATAHNAVLGANFNIYMTGLANTEGSASGSQNSTANSVGRQAMIDWAATSASAFLRAIVLNPSDLALQDAQVHPSQVGQVTMSNYLRRAMRPANGLANSHLGPVLTGGTYLSGTNVITLTNLFPSGSTAMSIVGSPASRFTVWNHGSLTTGYTVSTVALASGKIVLTLATTPPASQSLDVGWTWAADATDGQWVNMIYDNSNADGQPNGRQLMQTPTLVLVTAV